MKFTPVLSVLSVALLLGACGNDSPPAQSAQTPADTTAAAPAPADTAAAPAPAVAAAAPTGGVDGNKIYTNTCALCHATGVAGAPMPGNKDDWGPRIAQGNDTLYKHALEGFTGQKGMMPPRGGNPSLTDEEIKAAVDFMVQTSG